MLLVPVVTELEWVIRPQLEEWAEVATFDVPGVGDEPSVEPLDRQAVIDRALAELDRRAWKSYVLVCDGSALPTGVRVAHARPDAVEAMALGHARVVNRVEGDRRRPSRVLRRLAPPNPCGKPGAMNRGIADETERVRRLFAAS